MAAPSPIDPAGNSMVFESFQRSSQDVLNALRFFFGEPNDPDKLKNYSERHAATYQFPDAFTGSNIKIRDTLNSLILHEPQQWQTQVALPFLEVDGVEVAWDEIKFDMPLLQRVPYEGISRMHTSIRRRHVDRVVRRGMAMIIESDFYTTAAGRKHFQDQVLSIRMAVQETCNFDVMHAYLTAPNKDFEYDMKRGARNKRNAREAMRQEIMMYGIVQKDGYGFDRCVEEGKTRMMRHDVKPDMLIVPPQLLLYLSVGPEEKIKYDYAGELGVNRFEAGVAGYEARGFRGLGVFTSIPYEASAEDNEALQLLQRNTQVGEFYMMAPPVSVSPRTPLPGNYMDIQIYNEEKDAFDVITFADALMYSGFGRQDFPANLFGDYSSDTCAAAVAMKKFYPSTSDGPASEWPNAMTNAGGDKTLSFADAWKEVQKLMTTDRQTEASRTKLVDLVTSGKYVPIKLMIARPFIEHHSLSAVMTKAGADTGRTLFGLADMQIAANVQVKTIEGHYTCHTKAVITKPDNVKVLPDIMLNGYITGGNSTFFLEGKVGNDNAKIAGVEDLIQERLNFANGEDAGYASLLAFAMPFGGAVKEAMTVSNRVLPWQTAGADNSGVYAYFPGGKDGYEYYQPMFGLESIHQQEDVQATSTQAFFAQSIINNSLMFPGPYIRYSGLTMTGMEKVAGQGHLGPDVQIGDARWRSGEAISASVAREIYRPA